MASFKVGTDAGRHKRYNFRDGPAKDGKQTLNYTLTDLMLISLEDKETGEIIWKEKSPCADRNTRLLAVVAQDEDSPEMIRYIQDLQVQMTQLEEEGIRVEDLDLDKDEGVVSVVLCIVTWLSGAAASGDILLDPMHSAQPGLDTSLVLMD